MSDLEDIELTKEEQLDAFKLAKKIADNPRPKVVKGYVLAVIYENMRLLKLVNQHREQLGLDLIPMVDNTKARIG